MTWPGGGVHPVAGVTWVGVRAGWRRRGLLRGIVTKQLHDLHVTGGEAVAILTASEAALYGRYGYGPAINRGLLELTQGAPLRADAAADPVLEVAPEHAHPEIKRLHALVAPTIPGYLARPESFWLARLSDHPEFREGASRRRFGLHPDGFVSYRLKSGWNERGPAYILVLDEICAATPRAHASLWRYLLTMDLVRTISYRMLWLDDPLRDLLVDPRAARVTAMDHVWARIVDVDRAMALRAYSAAARVRIEITDAACPWNAGTWQLDLSAAGGAAARTTRRAELALDIADLGACLLGGTPLARLAAAGRVAGDHAAIATLDRALATPLLPWCPESF
jgi:predicted acetyltransferase